MSAEDADLQDSGGRAPVEMLCLRRSQLTDIEGSVVNNHMLKVSLVGAFPKATGLKMASEGRKRCQPSFLENEERNERFRTVCIF